jgi:hypothetical protein
MSELLSIYLTKSENKRKKLTLPAHSSHYSALAELSSIGQV